MHVVVYIDNNLILVGSKEKALDQVEGMVHLQEFLSFVVNKEKSVLIPSQSIEFLGLMIDSINMELQLPLHKIKVIQVDSRKLLRGEATSAHLLAHLLGKMNVTACVISSAPLFYRHLHMALSNMLKRNAQNYQVELEGYTNVQMEWEINPQVANAES